MTPRGQCTSWISRHCIISITLITILLNCSCYYFLHTLTTLSVSATRPWVSYVHLPRLLLSPFKRQLDRICVADWACIMLPPSKEPEWRMMSVLPLLSGGISSWRQGRGNPLRHTTTHTDTGVSLDSPFLASNTTTFSSPSSPFHFPCIGTSRLLSFVCSLILCIYTFRHFIFRVILTFLRKTNKKVCFFFSHHVLI